MRIIHTEIFTPEGTDMAKGAKMSCLRHIPDGEIEADDSGTITYVGPTRPHTPATSATIDVQGRAAVPGFVDSHTHLIFGGYRADEFQWRMRGDTYMSIMQRGGGIANTMKATREASPRHLADKARTYIDRMSQMGVTTVEAKSGYGLDEATEIKQLEVIRQLDEEKDKKVDLVSTYLGGHALPPEYAGRHDDYIDFMITRMLPLVKSRGLADNCDIFCEKGVFDIPQSERLLSAAKDAGYGIKIHADEIVNTGGAQLAARLGALSADHLLHISPQGIADLADSAATVATLLPLTAFTLREPYAPGRQMIDSGCAVALATDLNPGSCLSGSIPLTFALACIHMRLSIEEALTALTLNGAAALGLAHAIGTIEEGKTADLAILDAPHINVLPYYTGMNAVKHTIKRGKKIAG